MGEYTPSVDWAAIGKAVRLTMAARLQSAAACETGKKCLTEDNFDTEVQRNITDYVNWFDSLGESGPASWDNLAQQDADRQCALGNPAACL